MRRRGPAAAAGGGGRAIRDRRRERSHARIQPGGRRGAHALPARSGLAKSRGHHARARERRL
eukprot:388841-Pleurochrysis_carterae.AAC.1